MNCPYCFGECNQGDDCPSRPPRDLTAIRWVVIGVVVFWTVIGVIVVRSCT